MRKILMTLASGLALALGVWTLAVTFSPVNSDFSSGEAVSAAEFNSLFSTIDANFDAAEVAIDDLEAAQPGFNHNRGGEVGTPISINGTAKSVASVTLEAPSAGFAIVMASANALITHTSGETDNIILKISKTAGDITSDFNSTAVRVDRSFPSSQDQFYFPVSLTAVFSVTAGNNTFHLNAQERLASSSTNDDSVLKPQLTALFIPARYGSGAAPSNVPSIFRGFDYEQNSQR